MDTTANFAFSNKQKCGYPMRIALMSEHGAMHTIWLPLHMDGRYKFVDKDGTEDVSFIYIEARENAWYAFCGKDAFFCIDEHGIGKSVQLFDQSLIKIVFKDQKYALYAEKENENSNVFHAYYIEKNAQIHIGRSHSCDICYPNKLVSRSHAVLYWAGACWNIRDDESRNGVYLNGRAVKEAPVKIGDVIYIMGLRIAMGTGFITINDTGNRVEITTPYIRRILSSSDVQFSLAPARPSEDQLFKRQPRRKLSVDYTPIEIEMPPVPLSSNQIPLLMRMGSPMVMGGRALMAGNIAMMLTSFLFPLLTNGYAEKDRKNYEERRQKKYTEYLQEKEEEIIRARDHESKILAGNYPPAREAIKTAYNRERLWERRKTDDDFLCFRIGSGRIPISTPLDYQPRKFSMESDILEQKMYELAEKEYAIDGAPILFSCVEDFLCGISGSRENKLKLIQMLCMQIAVYHSYDEVKLAVLAEQEDMRALDFVRYLPHCWDDERSIRLLASTKADAYRIGEYLKNQFGDELEKPRKLKEILKNRPYYVIISLSKNLFDGVEVFKQVMQQDESCGVSIIAAYDGVPIECSKLIELQDNNDHFIVDLRHTEKSDQHFSMDYIDRIVLDTGGRKISGIRLKHSAQEFSLPKTFTFLEMFDAGKVEHLNPLKRWTDNNPVKSLEAPVGVGTDGSLFYLDLHEKKQGPHGLVAGMTGSGKSEFIITYILSMAVNYNPDEVAFILIDYKGGGLTGAFADERRGIYLPHLVGTITNLDGAAIQRALMSINSELKRRQALFNEAKSSANEGTMDIYTYQKLYRQKKVSEPLPHLFIISDEFAELKKQQPDFMDELISTARIGRSLGVHLILATQKPSGVVNDQIWSNTKFRVCLRVQDKSDSMDMLKRPEAAELKDTGRFYLQVGYNEYFAMGQSAWCGADYYPQDEVAAEEDMSVQFLDLTGQTISQTKPEIKRQASGIKQIVAVVKYLSDIAKRENIHPRKLWLEPLSSKIELETLQQRYYTVPTQGITALMGMVDDPERQRQFPLFVDLQACRNYLIVGNSGSGKSTFLRTMLYSLVSHYSPEQLVFYIMDFSGGGLLPFNQAPHCGAYVTENNESDIDRLLEKIKKIVAERKELFAKADVSNYNAYCKVAELPLVLLVIDNFSGLSALNKGSAYYSVFHEYLREAVSYGIKAVVSVNHFNELSSRSKQEIGDRISLHLKDRYDYIEALNNKTKFVPPDINGRGLCVVEGRTLEYHTAVLGCDSNEQEQSSLLKRRVGEITREKGYVKTPYILNMFDPEETYASFAENMPAERIPLGYSNKMQKVAIPLQQLYCMSLFMGNPAGESPMIKNILFAAQRDNMQVIVIPKKDGSIFRRDEELKKSAGKIRLEYLDCSEEGTYNLLKRVNDEIIARKVYRNAYCEQYSLPTQGEDTMRRASKYIRANTSPLLVLFESFYEFCKSSGDACQKNFPIFFEQGKGYNIYFIGCFYPSDGEGLITERLFKAFTMEQFALFFGGRYDKQSITMLPETYRKMNKINPAYNKGLMKYQGSFHELVMPCGEIDDAELDLDESPII